MSVWARVGTRARLTALLAKEAIRSAKRLSQAPGFTVVAVLTTGIALTPLLLSGVIQRLLMPEVPFSEADQLVIVSRVVLGSQAASSYPKYQLLSKGRPTEA